MSHFGQIAGILGAIAIILIVVALLVDQRSQHRPTQKLLFVLAGLFALAAGILRLIQLVDGG